MNTQQHIEVGSQVTMHVKVMLMDKSVAQDTRQDDEPVVVEIGNGHFTPDFEQNLLGLRMGETKNFVVSPKDSFGEAIPANIHLLSRDKFPKDRSLEEGVVFLFAQPDGNELPGIVRKIREDQVTVDFNHPLCGQDLIFEVEILNIHPVIKH